AVAISPDGATIAIGAPGAGGGAGTAAVFTRPGSDWSDDDTPTATLVPPASVTGDKFGTAVAIDGGMVAVGAPGTASLGMAGAGAAHVFDGTTRIATLEPDPQSADVDTAFGASLALSGGRLVVGAPNENIGGRPDGGAVRLYEVDASSVGAPTLLVPPGTDFNKWGASVAIDGRTVVGGAPGAGGANGAAFVFQAADGGMVLRARLDGGPDSAGAGMGGSIAVSGDYILVGAPLADVGGRADQGRAFVFLQPEGGWRDAAANGSLVAADGAAGDGYGSAVSLSRRGAAIGIPKRDLGSEADQGQADSFILDRIFRGAFE
ncbi:MAG TPA: hypothetical protein VFO79_08840, partial [Xanthomonadales bacterium]|nr:hypothetical protein [Xanthomonadales bacterium]